MCCRDETKQQTIRLKILCDNKHNEKKTKMVIKTVVVSSQFGKGDYQIVQS